MPGESDDGLWVDTQDAVATNTRCPLTGKSVLELTEPVKCAQQHARRTAPRRHARLRTWLCLCRDNKGYVYEKEAILSYIRKKGGGSVISPNAGARREHCACAIAR